MTKPRIAHIITAANDGGIEHMVHQICLGLSSEFDFTIYALLNKNSRETSLKQDSIPFKAFSARNIPGGSSWLPNIRAIFDLSSELKSWQADIVQVHDFFPSVLGRLSATLAGVPHTIATLHNTYEWLGPTHGLVNRALSFITDRVVGVSQACIDDSKKRDHLPPEIYRVIHNGVDQERFIHQPLGRKKVRTELGIPEDAILIGNIGTLSIRKGQDTLLQACSKIISRHPNLHIAIVGSARQHERNVSDNLARLASSPSLNGHVHFLENRHDIPEILSAFDVFSMPSRQEGFGIALAEAMLINLPLVLSDIPAFREVAGDSCIHFHSIDDGEALADHLDTVISSIANGTFNQPSAQRRALSLFSEKNMFNSWAQLYRELT